MKKSFDCGTFIIRARLFKPVSNQSHVPACAFFFAENPSRSRPITFQVPACMKPLSVRKAEAGTIAAASNGPIADVGLASGVLGLLVRNHHCAPPGVDLN